MSLTVEHIFIIISVLAIVSIVASKFAARLSVPALLLFLLIGMLAGSDGPGGIYFDDVQAAQTIGVVALTYILFAGGVDTSWREVRPQLANALTLATFGVFLTALFVAWFVTTFLGLSPLEGILLGSIISSTDAAAVFAVLRGRGVGLKGQLKPLLELESGSNDPMAIFLTIGFTTLLTQPDTSILQLIPMFFQQMLMGVVFGYLFGRLMTYLINLLRLEYDGLYSVLTMALVLLAYGVTASLGGSGFLAVYVAGITLANSDFIHKGSLTRFHDGLAWLMQITMFLALGLLVYPSQLVQVIVPGLATALFLMLVARPLSVFLTLPRSRLTVREKLLVSWVGLRGATPIVLATFPLLAGVDQTGTIFNVVFFVVFTSVLLQGTTLAPVARLLGLDAPIPRRKPSLEIVQPENLKNRLVEMTIPASSPADGKRIVDLRLPSGSLIVLISRDSDVIVPGGSTPLQAGDTLLVFADEEVLTFLREQLVLPVSEMEPLPVSANSGSASQV